MSLPKEIFAPNIPIGHVQANGDVLMNSNWWLLIYNIVLNSIGSEGSIAPSGLIELAALDSDVNDTDSTSLRSPIANLSQIDPLLDYVPSLTYSNQLLLSLGATFVNQTAPSNPAASRISLYSASSGSSGQNQLTTLDPNGVSLVLGFENHMVVYNGSGSDIAVGQLVYISGSHATTPSIALAKADSLTTLPAVGFTQYAIPNGQYGQIHVSGSVAATTTGFADGDEIYTSASVAGAFTKTAPSTAGQYVQQVGVVTNGGVGAGAGRLQFLFLTAVQAVRSVATGGTGLSTTPTDGQLLIGNTSTNAYSLSALSAGTGITVTNGSGTISIANSGATSISGTANRITASASTGSVTIDISASYVGQSSITTLGTVTTGTWSAGVVTTARCIVNGSTIPANGIYLPAANTLGLAAGSALGWALDANGRFLSGTTSSISVVAGNQLQIHAAGAVGSSIVRYSNNSTGCAEYLGKSRSATVVVGGAVQSGDSLGIRGWVGDDGTTLNTVACKWEGVCDGAVATNQVPGRLDAYTANSGGTLTLALRIDSSQDTLAQGNLKISTVGKGLYVKEGTNATMGTATLVGGTVTVSTTKVTANSRIIYSVQTAGGTQGFLSVSARSAGTSFTLTSTSGTETSTVAWMIVEPA